MVRNLFILSEHVSTNSIDLISLFCDKNITRLLRTSGFNVKVLKINLTAVCNFFTISKGAQLRLVVMNNR